VNLFSECLNRLKPMLRVSKDQEVAAALGLSKTAFSERKKRDSFPDRELRALARARPELNIDVDYVLTGVAQAALEIIDAAKAGTPLVKVRGDELQLLQNYRSCSPPDQEVVRHQAAFLAARGKPSGVMEDGRYPQRVDEPPPVLHDKPTKKGK
jgi:transcriptional regulator with XRE-family HTH domain